MLKRIYIDNYKCLVSFECHFEDINLILGLNGSGKSTVFKLLRNLQDVVNGRSPVGLFGEGTLTRWQNRNVQTFELEIDGNGGVYEYHLEIEHEVGQNKQRIPLEQVTFDGCLIYKAELGEIHIFLDGGREGPTVSGDRTQSSLRFLGARSDNTQITWFKEWFASNLVSLQIDPLHTLHMTEFPTAKLDWYAKDFVGWYRHRVATDMAATMSLYSALSDMYDDFGGLKLEQEGGSVQHLYASIGVQEEQKGKPEFVTYSFGELSDGERALIILYTLLQLMKNPDMTLCLDEPDNFLALAEIQPWLLNLKEAVESAGSQALLISHHPELINNLAPSRGLLFERRRNGSTRVRAFPTDISDECLTPSEVVARGWE